MRRGLLAACLIAAPGTARACGLALALAVDVSGSVDAGEYRVQMQGLAAALSDRRVAAALIEARAAVMLIQWTGASRQEVSVPWTRVTGPAALADLSAAVEAAPRRWRNYSTGIGTALAFAGGHFAAVADCGRRVIDVSGDGRSNEGPGPRAVAAGLAARGIVVNGLAITGSEPLLEAYFRDEVIAGPGAFVVATPSHYEYPQAIRRKLLAEVTRPVAGAPGGAPGGAFFAEVRP